MRRKSIGIALIDQAVLSLFNLGLNLLLIRLAAPAEFGRFIYAAAVVLVLTSLQNALVTTPLSILVPGRAPADQRTVLSVLGAFDVLLRIAAAVLAPLLCLMTDHAPDFLLAVAAVAYTTLGREMARSRLLAFEKTTECLRLDCAAVGLSLLFTGLLWRFTAPAIASLAGLAVGNLLAVALLVPREPSQRPAWTPRQTLIDYRRRFWNDTQWSLIGAGTTELQYRSYVFALELFRDAATLASVQAGRLLLGPLPLVVGAWGRVARPAMARRLAAGDHHGLLRITAQGLVYVIAVGCCYCLVLFVAWKWAESLFFHGRYPDVGRMTAAWGAYMITVIAHMVLSVPLQAAMKLKELALVTLATAALSCLLLLALHFNVPPIYAVFALTIGEVVALIWIVALVVKLSRSLNYAATVASAPSEVKP